MGIQLANGQWIGDPNLGERLGKVVRDVTATNNFGVEAGLKSKDPALYNPYTSNHKSSVKVAIFFGPIFVTEAAAVEIVSTNSKSPVYPYASPYYATMIEGKFIGQGNLYIFETKTGELLASIAKYKTLLETSRITDLRIREIAAQRMNLFAANITNTLLKSVSNQTDAKLLADTAIARITTELITGDLWNIPRMTIVSGNAIDPDPLIDVLEDVVFDKDSKSIVPDGSTQMRVYGFSFRRNLVREEPSKAVPNDKWLVDLAATIRATTDLFTRKLIDNLDINVKRYEYPLDIHPNNVMYTGSLPDGIVGWGGNEQKGEPALFGALRFSQAVPKDVSVDAPIVKYKRVTNSDGTTSELKDDDSSRMPVLVQNIYRWASPDANEMAKSVRIISRSFPTMSTLAFSWLVAPPVLPNLFKLSDEAMADIQGATLTQAFYSMRMSSPSAGKSIDGKTTQETVKAQLPVRSLSYLQGPAVDKDKIISHKPISLPHVIEGSSSPNGVEKWIKDLRMADNEKYQYNRWFFVGFNVVTGNNILNTLLEALTLGLLGNIDGLETFSFDLKGFPRSLGTLSGQLGSVCVQVFPMFISDAAVGGIRGEFIGGSDGAFRMSVEMTEKGAAMALTKGICKDEGCKYIWSITDIQNNQFDPQMIFNMQWDKESLSGAVFDYVGCLIRVVSQSEQSLPPNTENTEMNQVNNNMEIVAPTSMVMCQNLSMDLVVRTDRKFVQYKMRDLENGGLLGLALQGIQKLSKYVNPKFLFDVSNEAKLLTETLLATRSQDTYFRTQTYGPDTAPPGVFYLQDKRMKNDVVDGFSSIIDSLTGFNPVSFVNQLTADSKIVGGQQYSPKLLSGWLAKVRFLIMIDPIADEIATQITNGVRGVAGITDDPRVSDPAKTTIDGVTLSNNGVVQQVKDALITSLENYGRISGFTVRSVNASEYQSLILTPDQKSQFVSKGFSGTDTYLILESSTVPPSPFVLDGVQKGKEKEYLRESEGSDSLGIGFEEV